MTYGVRFTRKAQDDLERLYDLVLEREIGRGVDLVLAERALEAIENGIATLSFSPFTCRKAGTDPFIRELVIPFGGAATLRCSKSSRAIRSRSLRSGISARTTATECRGTWDLAFGTAGVAGSLAATLTRHAPNIGLVTPGRGGAICAHR